jgi:acetyl esterase/lipase
MDRRNFIRKSAGGSIANLLALTGRSQAAALVQLAASPGINPSRNRDFLVLEPDSASFQSLTQGFNGR